MILVQSIIKRLRIWFLFIDVMSWFGLLPDTRWQNLRRTRDNSWYTKVRLLVANFWTRRKSDSGYAYILLADIRGLVRWNVNNFPRSLLQFLSGYPELPICIRSFFFFLLLLPSLFLLFLDGFVRRFRAARHFRKYPSRYDLGNWMIVSRGTIAFVGISLINRDRCMRFE